MVMYEDEVEKGSKIVAFPFDNEFPMPVIASQTRLSLECIPMMSNTTFLNDHLVRVSHFNHRHHRRYLCLDMSLHDSNGHSPSPAQPLK